MRAFLLLSFLCSVASAQTWEHFDATSRRLERSEKWPEAAAAAARAIDLMNERLAAVPVAPPPRDFGPVANLQTETARLDREKREIRPKRLDALLRLGTLQRDRLAQPHDAAETFSAGLPQTDPLLTRGLPDLHESLLNRLLNRPDPLTDFPDGEVGHERREMLRIRAELLRERGITFTALGRIPEALDDHARANLASAILGGNGTHVDVAPIASALRLLPKDAELPPTPMLHVLSSERPDWLVDLSTNAPCADAFFWQFANSGMRAYRFHLTAAPGQAIRRIELSAEFERKGPLKMGYSVRLVGIDGAQLSSTQAPLGRETMTRAIDIPPGRAGELLHLEIMGTAAEPFAIHSVGVKAVFAEDAARP